jgi:hypothetical protein
LNNLGAEQRRIDKEQDLNLTPSDERSSTLPTELHVSSSYVGNLTIPTIDKTQDIESLSLHVYPIKLWYPKKSLVPKNHNIADKDSGPVYLKQVYTWSCEVSVLSSPSRLLASSRS